MKVLSILILSISLLVLNFLLKKGIRSIRSSNAVFKAISRYYPIAELLFWSVFIVWAVISLFATSQFFIYIIFLLITMGFVLFFLFFARDYVTGVQLKSRYHLSQGQRFKSGQLSGTVKRTDLLYVEIKGDDGTDYKIPYHQLDQKTIALDFQEKSGGESMVKVELDGKLERDEVAKKIVELAINSPWCSHKITPRVHISESKNGLTIYEVSCLLVGEHAARHLRELIESDFSKKSK